MQKRRWWAIPLLAGFLAAVSISGAEGEQAPDQEARLRLESRHEASLDYKNLDALIYKTLRKVINEGADLYNCGDRDGCYRLWQGSLLTLRPLLECHPELQKEIDEVLAKPVCPPHSGARAFALRDVLDDIRRETMPRPEQLPHPSPAAPMKTLWERLGGEKGVSRVVATFLKLVQNDSRVNFWRKPNYKPSDKQVEDLKKQLVEWISSQTGGPYEYKGKSMREVHKGMGITDAEFTAAEDDLQKALSIQGVQTADANALLSIVESTRGDIVQPAATGSRWERLGGEAGVTAIVNDFMDAALGDPKVNFYNPNFKPQPETVHNLKKHIVEQISSLTDGPLKYSGPNMRQAHRRMGISSAQFDAFLDHVRQALEKHKAQPDDVTFLMGKYNEMRGEIVQMPAAPTEPAKGS